MTRVDGTTQVYAVLGDPVHHTLSPQMQNAAFAAAGINAVYVALEVPAPRLDHALAGLHAAGVKGLNLTTPHKEAAFRDKSIVSRRQDAEWALAANTLRWESNGWTAHATDGVGFLNWLAIRSVYLRDKRILMLGAGGAARQIVGNLLTHAPESIHVVSRTLAHAESAARRFGDYGRVTAASMERREGGGTEARTKSWQVIVRALSVEPVSDEEEVWWKQSEPGAMMFDLNYGDRASDARALAQQLGLIYESGEELLVQQGAASFEFWTGKKPSLQAMRKALQGAE